MIKEGIQKLIESRDLTMDEASKIMEEIMVGEAKSSQIASFLTALRIKGETTDEITALVEVMRKHSVKINPKVSGKLVDTCGTGGDKIKTFNISTCAAFVIAGAGIPVAKHGNRSVTSTCGSADLLEDFGMKLDSNPEVTEAAIEKVGIGFLFAPTFHPAMKHVATVRRDLGIRTVFNIIGPLSSPALVNNQVLGVFDSSKIESLAIVLKNLGSEEVMVVSGLDGVDEISTFGKTKIAHLKHGKIRVYESVPSDFGVKEVDVSEIVGSTREKNVEMAFKILRGSSQDRARVDAVLVNAAAGIVVGGGSDKFEDALEIARTSLTNGSSYQKLKELIHFQGKYTSRLEELERKFG